MSVARFAYFIFVARIGSKHVAQVKDEVAALLGTSPEPDKTTTPSSAMPHTVEGVYSTVPAQSERSEAHPAEAVAVVRPFPEGPRSSDVILR